MTKTVAVIGAGIAGLTTAYYLAKKGYRVDVYEQQRHTAMRCSYANGGQISVSNSEVWTTWPNVKKGFKWLFKKDAPLLIRPRLDPAQWSWLARFLYHTIKGDYKKNTEWTIRAGLQARKLYEELIKEEGIEFDKLDSGILHFYKDDHYWTAGIDVRDTYVQNGCEWDLLIPSEVRALDPTLQNVQGILGGAFTPSDWTGDIHKFCVELAGILKTKYQVRFSYSLGIDDLSEVVDLYDAVVIAAGIGSNKLAKSIGDNLHIYPVKGYSITINNIDPKLLPKVSLLDDQAKIVTSTLGNRLRVAGTAELAGENYDIIRNRIDPLLDWVHVNFPDIDTSNFTQWACLRPMTPNMLPVTKKSDKNPKVYYNTGHGHLGWTLSPYTSKKVADLI